MRKITLIKTPGGASSIEVAPGTTYRDLVNAHGLKDYTITINGGVGIDQGKMDYVIGQDVTKVFAAQSIKGN